MRVKNPEGWHVCVCLNRGFHTLRTKFLCVCERESVHVCQSPVNLQTKKCKYFLDSLINNKLCVEKMELR